MDKAQSSFDIAFHFSSKNYEKIIDYANEKQEELIHNWQVRDREKLQQIVLTSKHILYFWVDSIMKNRFWYALVRCGVWIGTLEAIERSVYEDCMDMWLQKRMVKKFSSIKHLSEILHLLEVKGVMTHGELAEKLDLHHPSTLTEIMKKIADLKLITIQKSGKNKLYCLTDAGIPYAKQIRAGVDEEALASHLQSLGSEERGVLIKPGQDIGIITDSNRRVQNMKVENILKEVSYDSNKRRESDRIKNIVGKCERSSLFSGYRYRKNLKRRVWRWDRKIDGTNTGSFTYVATTVCHNT